MICRMRAPGLSPMAFAVAFLLLLTPAVAQDFRFSTIEVRGNERVTDQTVLGHAGLSPGQSVSAAAVNDAMQRVRRTELFETVEFEPRGNTLVINVREYPVIGIINFEGNRRIDDEELREFIQSRPNRAYSPSTVEEDTAALAELYRQRGRFAAEIEPRILPRPDNRVDIAFEIREGDTVEIERVSFVGNRNFSDRRLRRVLSTKQAGLLRTFISSDRFVAERIDADRELLRDFYLDRGYVDFEVLSATPEMSQERDAFFLTFNIREGQSFDIANVTVTSEIEDLPAAPFEEALRLRPGSTFSPRLIDNNITRLERVADRMGRRFVRVEPRIERNERDLTLDVEFALVRGERIFVERIDIRGNTTTQDRVVRRQFDTVEGDPFNPREIRRAAERIRALDAFAQADVDARQGSSEEQVVIDVDVEEQPTGSLGFGVSFGRDAGLGGAINFSETNLMGRGQRLDLSFSFGTDNQDTSINFVEPHFLDRDLRLGLNAFYRRTEGFNVDYDTQSVGFSPSLGFPVGELGRLRVNYSLSSDKLKNVSPNSSPILAREADFGAITSSVGYSFTYDQRDGGLDPVTSFYTRVGQDLAGLGGDRRYIRSTALAGVERMAFNEDVTLRAELEGGALHMLRGNSRVLERSFLNEGMRGFAFNGLGPRDTAATNRDALGGNYFAVARFEADFPLGLPEEYGINGGVFLDVGTVWGLDDIAGSGGSNVDDSFSLRSTIGFAVFWETPIGPLRFDISQNLRKKRYDQVRNFDVSISTRF